MDTGKSKLDIILNLFPYLKDIDTLLPILKGMEINTHGIRALLTTGYYDAFVRAIDPDSGIEYLDYRLFGGIRYTLKDVDGSWQVFINDKPYKEYFTELRERDNKPLQKNGKYLDDVSENIVFRQAIRSLKETDSDAYEKIVSLIQEKGEVFLK